MKIFIAFLLLFIISCAEQGLQAVDQKKLPRTAMDTEMIFSNLAQIGASTDLYSAYYFDNRYTVVIYPTIEDFDYTPTTGDVIYLLWNNTTACTWTFDGTSFVTTGFCMDKIIVRKLDWLSFSGIPKQKSVKMTICF